MDKFKAFDGKILNNFLGKKWSECYGAFNMVHSQWASHSYTKVFGMHAEISIKC